MIPAQGARRSTESIGAGAPSELAPHPLTLQDDENALLRRVAGQDYQAFDLLYVRYAPCVRGYLTRRLAQADLVDDVLQEVMLVLWQRASHCPPTVPLVAWLYGIARYKAWKAWSHTSLPARPPAGHAALDPEDPESLLLRQESGRMLACALDTLPFHERAVLRLVVQQDWSYRDIAVEMEIPVSTVRTRVSRACQRLRAGTPAVDRRSREAFRAPVAPGGV